MHKNFHCHSLRLAGFLMLKGFVLVNMEPDNNSRRNVYIFKKSDDLSEAINEYKNQTKN